MSTHHKLGVAKRDPRASSTPVQVRLGEPETRLRWQVGRFLDVHGVTAGTLVRTLEGELAARTVYALARDKQQQLRLETLAKVMAALEELTGECVELADLIEHKRD